MSDAADTGLDAGRAGAFALLGRLLTAPADAGLLDTLRALPADSSEIGAALGALAAAAAAATPEAASRAYQVLFVGVGRGELLPYASYYRTGFLNERPLAELRDALRALGVDRAPGVVEPEDHLGFVCQVMAGLLDGRFPGGPDAAEAFQDRHLRPWAARAFSDLETARGLDADPPSGAPPDAGTRLYRAVGALGRTVMEIEAAAAALPA